MTLTIYTDGGARGNPGPAASAFIVLDQTKKLLHKEARFLGKSTNNDAEYKAVLMAYRFLDKHYTLSDINSLSFIIDSLLVVKQLKGEYKIKNKNLIDLVMQIKSFEKNIASVSYSHVPREQNSAADALVNECLDTHT